jgi:hypothetical protein
VGKQNGDAGGETTELLQKRIEQRCRKGECQKTKGKRKAWNTEGRGDFRKWGKVKKIKRKVARKGGCRGDVKMSKCRTRGLSGGTPEEGT